MAVSRNLRRTSPLTLVISVVLLIGLLLLVFTPAGRAPLHVPGARQLLASKDAASNILSPPSLPFVKSRLREGEIPPPPPVVHYKMNNVTTSSDPIGNRESVLILTPLVRFYQGYWDSLLELSYPHDLISLGFIIPKGREGNKATAQLQARIAATQADSNKNRFASITILRQENEPPLASQNEKDRHAMKIQKERRSAMSKARNALLFTTLGPTTSWVLWLDADIVEFPPSLIQDMAHHNKPIIVPNCFQRYLDPETGKGKERPYDFNSWVDSDSAKELASKMGPDDILLEGYKELPTYRTLMAMLSSDTRDREKIMQLDGVGGTALLVKAEVHRDGAMFPPFPFYHLVETEGFAKMASRLGWTSWGLPDYRVYHHNE